jgi:hypothetical protein
VWNRLSEKVAFVANGCWEWTAGRDHAGYGRIGIDGTPELAHRVAYEIFVGPIPDGLTLDHLCRNPACVHPLHLEPVSMVENVRRGIGIGVANAMKTHCPQGHPLIAGNLINRSRPGRECLACARERMRRNRAGG